MSKSGEWYFRDRTIEFLETHVESRATKYVRPAFEGDVKAARIVSVCELGGFIAVSMWRARVPGDW